MKKKIDSYIKKHDLKNCESLYMSLDERERLTKTMITFSVILKIARMEEDNGVKGLFWREDCRSIDELVKLYDRIKYYLRRIEYDIDLDLENELVNLNVSKYMLLMMISLFSMNKQKVAVYMKECFDNVGNREMKHVLHEFLCKAEALNGGV